MYSPPNEYNSENKWDAYNMGENIVSPLLKMTSTDKTLEDALVKESVLPASEARRYLLDAQAQGEPLKDFLLNQEIVTRRQILTALSRSLELEMIDFNTISVDQAMIERVPVKFVWYYKFMPVRIKHNILTIATASILDIKIQDEIRMHLGLEIEAALADENDLTEADPSARRPT